MLILWFALSLYILFTVDIFSFAIGRSGWRRFISTFILFYLQVILSEFILGISSLLTSKILVFTNLALSSIILFAIIKVNKQNLFSVYVNKNTEILSGLWKKIKNDRLFIVLLILFACLLFWIIFVGIISPAIDWDGNSYHLTFIAYAIQNHNIFDVNTSLAWLKGYPKSGELIEMWSIIVAKNDVFADLSQLPFLLLGVFSLYKIATSIGAKKTDARFVALLYLFFPIVINQLKTSYIDVILCSLFFASIALALEKKLAKLDLLLMGIIYSLIISLKYTGFLFMFVSLPILFYSLYVLNSKKINHQLSWYSKKLILVILPASLGLFWYIKNLVLYHNAFYPFGFKLFGVTIFGGKTFQSFASSASVGLALPHSYLNKIWFVWTEQRNWFGCFYNYDTNYAGLGPIWFVVMLPATILSLYLALKNKNYLYLWLTILVGIIFIIYPANYYTRYTMFISIVGVYSLGLLLSNMAVAYKNIVKFITIILALIVIQTNFTFCNFSPSVIVAQYNSFMAGNSRMGPAYQNTIGVAYIKLQSQIKPNEVVAYDSSPNFIYPLWNRSYSDKVIYIPANNSKEYFDGINANKVKYLFIDFGSKEYKWIAASNLNKPIYKDDQYEIYKLY